MTRIVWDQAGTRFYETGIDRGVLYVGSSAGVPWSGLTSISKKASGGDPDSFYFDGFNYLNVAALEEYEATIEAFSAPAEFAPCDGIASLHQGLFVDHQPRKTFGLSYRTRIGNDLKGLDLGYKLHIVYNALAAPSDRDNSSVSDSVEPMKLSWEIIAAPKIIAGVKPTAHLIIDSRYTNVHVLNEIEGQLYGNSTTTPNLPTPEEILTIFTTPPAPNSFVYEFEGIF